MALAIGFLVVLASGFASGLADEHGIDWGFVVVKPPLEICFVGLIWGKNVLLKIE